MEKVLFKPLYRKYRPANEDLVETFAGRNFYDFAIFLDGAKVCINKNSPYIWWSILSRFQSISTFMMEGALLIPFIQGVTTKRLKVISHPQNHVLFRRWFIYDERRCLLHYYHRPQDVEALGHINIATASFNVRADDKFTFEISCEGRTYQLQAPDRNTMLFWLQELRTRR